MDPLTEAEATAAGFRSVTAPYSNYEQELLKRAIEQFKGVRIVLVRTAHGTEIWRVAGEIRGTMDEGGFSAADTKRPRHFGR